MILAAKEGKQTLFLVRNALERGYGVAGRVDGAAHRLFVKRLLGEDDGLSLGVGGRDLFHRQGLADGVVDVALAHAAHHAADLQIDLIHGNDLLGMDLRQPRSPGLARTN